MTTRLSEQPQQQQQQLLQNGWFFYLAEIALRRMLNDVLSSRYRSGSWYFSTRWWVDGGDGELCVHVDGFKQKLETWFEMLPPSVTFPRDANELVGDALSGILRSHLIDILDVLYFPAIRAVLCEPTNEVSPAVVSVARDGLQIAADRIITTRQGFWHRHQGTWLMTRTCCRSAFLLLGAALRAQTDKLEGPAASILPDRWRYCVNSVMECLEYWQDESPDLPVTLARLRDLCKKV